MAIRLAETLDWAYDEQETALSSEFAESKPNNRRRRIRILRRYLGSIWRTEIQYSQNSVCFSEAKQRAGVENRSRRICLRVSARTRLTNTRQWSI